MNHVGVLVTKISGGRKLTPMTTDAVKDLVGRLQKGLRTRVLNPSEVEEALADADESGVPQAAIGGWVANSYGYAAQALRVIALPDRRFALRFAGCKCARGARSTRWEMRDCDARRAVSNGG